MKKIDLSTIAVDDHASYPPPFDEPCNGPTSQRLGRSQGLTLFGVNLSVIDWHVRSTSSTTSLIRIGI